MGFDFSLSCLPVRTGPDINNELTKAVTNMTSLLRRTLATSLCSLLLGATALHAEQSTVTIAAVNNPDMLELKKLSSKFEQNNPDITLKWVIVEENILRQRVTTDVSTGSGQFDLVFIGLYETPIFAKRGWLQPMEGLSSDYDIEDVFKSLRDGLSYKGKLFALPFYGESSFLMYRKDLFEQKGLTMPDQPTFDDVAKLAAALNNRQDGFYGLALRGQPGWGENMAIVDTMANSFGASWFDMNWHPTLKTQEWKAALSTYLDLVQKYGPPSVTSNGFNENLTLFAGGKAAMWVDATVAGGILENPKQSQVVGKVGYAPAPIAVTPNGSHWLWSWAFAIPEKAKNTASAKKFVEWATSKQYIQLVAEDLGWASVPPGTRKSTYENPEYQKAAPFAKATLKAMETADPTNPSIKKVPYTGITFVGIPEFQSLGTVVGQNVSGLVAGKTSLEETLTSNQNEAERTMKQGGYIK
jgi:sorbitol/mannitol transport system substrate-binding protein